MPMPTSPLNLFSLPPANPTTTGFSLSTGPIITSLVVIGQMVYCCINDSDVLQYTLENGIWSELPKPSVSNFAMASLKGQLVLVGGKQKQSLFLGAVPTPLHSHEPPSYSAKITVWNTSSNEWYNSSYPPMPTAQGNAKAVSYKHYLLVAGCRGEVEVLDTTTGRWRSPESPPRESWRSSAVVGDNLYIHTGQSVFMVHIPTLVTTANNTIASIWQQLPGPPATGSRLLALYGNLLAVGDIQNTEEERKPRLMLRSHAQPETVVKKTIPIYRYDPAANKWVECGEWPLTLAGASCAVLPTGQLMAVLTKTNKLCTNMWLGIIKS